MLAPKRSKHRKAQRGMMKGETKRGATLAFGSFGLKALDEVWMSARQIESARQAMTRHMKREGNVWIRIFQISPLPTNPLRFVWVRVKEILSTTQLLCIQEESCSKFPV